MTDEPEPAGGRELPLEADLARRFGPALRLFALRRLRRAAEAEDVAQETLARALDALRRRRLADPAALPAFLYETARHVCQQRLRKLGREERAYERLAAGERTAFEPAALAELLGADRCALAAESLAGLPEGERELLRRIFFDEEPAESVAQGLGISAGAFRVRKHRALERLRRLFREAEARRDVTPRSERER
jgi:RNA polymerase sigma-70 factor (ECF subfamily)